MSQLLMNYYLKLTYTNITTVGAEKIFNCTLYRVNLGLFELMLEKVKDSPSVPSI